MPITVLCTGCSAKLTAPDGAAGKRVKCPKCQTVLIVLAPPPQPEAGPKFELVETPEEPPAPVRKRVHDDEDDDAAPMSLEREEKPAPSRPRPRRDEEEDDPEPPRRKKASGRGSSKRRGSRRSGGNPLAALGTGGAIGAAVGGVWLIGLVLGLIWAPALLLPVVIGYLVAFAGGIWFLVVAFSDSPAQGLLCLFIPFYSLIYLISNWEICKHPFSVQVGGMFMLIITSCLGGVGR